MQESNELSYFDQFAKDYRLTDRNNKIKLQAYSIATNSYRTISTEIFSEDAEGNLDILVYSLDKRVIQYDKPNAETDKDYNNKNKDLFFRIKRFKEPKTITNKNGETEIIKYQLPKGAGTFPFFHPVLLEKYEKKTPINTLVLTEGYKKAWLGCEYGADVVGLSSITHTKEKQTQAMYSDIIQLIKVCQVKNVVMLYDGDCLNLSSKALQAKKDLYTRPAGFYNSATTVRELLKDYKVDVYFSHITSDKIQGNPKGLDDLYLSVPGHENNVTEDLTTFSRLNEFFYKLNITSETTKLSRYFRFNPVDTFYNFHQEQIGGREFVYRGTNYVFDESKNELKVIVPGVAKDFCRVGDEYYKFVKVPNKYNQLEKQFHKRKKETIKEDYGKEILQHIPKYEAFCNVPSHTNYARVIHNCFNLYYEFDHEPEQGECPESLDFIKHIFGEQYELGLDYIQLLFNQPTQILPILCLVSRENKTGKSTFVKWLKAIFGQNATVVGNDALQNNFNASWAAKLLICCEETFVEKKGTIEKIKQLSTGDKIQMENKGKDANEIDFFGKYILCSNNEDTFIYLTNDDIRYWVVKVPTFKGKERVNLLQNMIEEIPAFLHFLNNREMHTQNETRMWFREELIRTESLKRLQDTSQPRVVKEIKLKLKELFLDSGLPEITMPLEYICETLLKRKTESEIDVRRHLETYLKVDRYKNSAGNYDSVHCRIPYHDTTGNVEFLNKRCRPYVFSRKDFITEIEETQHEPVLNTTTNEQLTAF